MKCFSISKGMRETTIDGDDEEEEAEEVEYAGGGVRRCGNSMIPRSSRTSKRNRPKDRHADKEEKAKRGRERQRCDDGEEEVNEEGSGETR